MCVCDCTCPHVSDVYSNACFVVFGVRVHILSLYVGIGNPMSFELAHCAVKPSNLDTTCGKQIRS